MLATTAVAESTTGSDWILQTTLAGNFLSATYAPGFNGSWICNRDNFASTTATTYTWNCFRFLPSTSAAADATFTTGTAINVRTFVNTAGTSNNAVFKGYTATVPTPVVTKSAISLVSSVALALGALTMFQ